MSIINDFKEVFSIVKKIGNVELIKKIADLQNEVYEVENQNRSLKDEVRQLQKEKEFRNEMKFREPFWYKENDLTPYCPRCWENDEKAIHLVSAPDDRYKKCPQCKSVFGDDTPIVKQITLRR